MGRGQSAPALVMTDRQRRVLEQESRKRTTLRQYHDRISILLYSQEGKSISWVSSHLSISYNTVKSWRRRWAAQYSTLLEFEKGKDGQGVSDGELLDAMLGLVSDLDRSGAPARITLAQKQQIIALACDKPDTYGVQMTDWTHEMLAKVAMAQGIVDTISRRHLGGILKKKPLATS
ncbi:MAG: helix-turn-helix domain-containing protein [Saprospiraceae bacterium]|nr:helix-turn-helix domain-containing protein [Saprospiraceae bacterium]